MIYLIVFLFIVRKLTVWQIVGAVAILALADRLSP